MSFKAVLAVLEHSQAEHGKRLVMISLAQHANDRHESCPAIASIASECKLSERSVHHALRWLEEAQEITRVGVEPRYNNTTIYRVNVAADFTLQKVQGEKYDTTGVQNDAEIVSHISPEPTTNQKQEPPSSGAGEQTALLPSPVQEVWKHYEATFPEGRRKLDSRRESIIKRALNVRTVDECKRAITALSQSSFHRGDNDRKTPYLDIEYALGKRGLSPDAVIDKWIGSATTSDGKPKSTVQQMFDALPQAEKAEIGLKIQQAKARFVRPQHQPTVRAAREAEAELRRYPGIEIIETSDGAFSGWRPVRDQL